MANWNWQDELAKRDAEIERLRAALRDIADCEEYDRVYGEFVPTEEAFIARAALGETP